MIWVFAIVVVLLLGGVAAVAAGRGEPLAPAYNDHPDVLVPSARPLTSEDLRRVRFTVGFRGYRTAEVDALLKRLARELDQHGPGEGSGERKSSVPEGTPLDSDTGAATPERSEDQAVDAETTGDDAVTADGTD